MLDYSFLVLTLILAVPAVVVWATRADLRRPIHLMMLASIPFAFTERLFYPEYWRPKFLFDLVNVIGFGIEDILFVTALAAFASMGWYWLTKRGFEGSEPGMVRRIVGPLVVCFGLVAVAAIAGVAMIYAAPAIMFVCGAAVCVVRSDLWGHALGGAALTTVVYGGVCGVLMLVIPSVFELDWNTDKFLNLFVLGIPVEELLYGSASGFVATVFYPFVRGAKVVPLNEAR